MPQDNNVGVLFKMNQKNHVTLVHSRSRNRFRKLISNWAPVEGELITNPKEGDNFEFVELNVILNEIENTYKELKNTPAIERIADKVFKMISTIRVQNDDDDDDDDGNDE